MKMSPKVEKHGNTSTRVENVDPIKPITLSVDVPQHGLDAVLLQENLSVVFASRALTNAQEGYAQIEKERNWLFAVDVKDSINTYRVSL